MIETLDDSIGRVLAKLEELRLVENTIVIFTSDNGGLHVLELPNTPATHNGEFRAGKGYLYEGGLREPLIVRWPGVVKPASIVETPVSISDLFPTVAEVAGQPLLKIWIIKASCRSCAVTPETKRRVSSSGISRITPIREDVRQGAVREGDWKLIEHYEDGRLELFNLSADPGESTDVAAQHPSRVAALRGALEGWRRSVGRSGKPSKRGF